MKKVLAIVVGAAVLAAQSTGGRGRATPASSPVTSLLQTLLTAVDSDQAGRDVRTIWETDRWFTFPKFEETARNVAAIMRRAGLEDVEIGNVPADGVTQGGFWTEPLAWDVHTGTLEIVEPQVPAEQRMLADYQKVPTSLCMWSGPTAAGGVVAEVVAPSGNLESADLKGKLVLSQRASKTALWKAGALGMISDSTENRELADERGWVNSFGDNGWSFTKGSSPLVCFSITPRGSGILRSLLAKGPVKVRANVDSRYYAGVYPYVTGIIRGTDGAQSEEVLSLGHLFEQGAHDNATGVASIIGAAATLNRLIQSGKLPRPRRTIRVLAMGECYGTMYYLHQHPDRVKRTIAAMCIDTPAGLQNLAGTEHTWVLNPHSAKSYVDAFVLRLAAEYYSAVGRPWTSQEHRSSTDNYLGDPTIGIPTVMPRAGYGVHAHHNSHDTPATVDPKSLRDLMVMNAAYTYFLAAAGPAEKRWLAELALTRGYQQVAAAAATVMDQIAAADSADRLGRLLDLGRERVQYSLERESQAVRPAADLGPELADFATFGQQQKARVAAAVRDRAASLKLGSIQPIAPARNPDAEKIVVRRKRIGTITLDDLSREQREGWPAAGFWGVPVSALYWCDGKRNLAEVIRLTQLEMGPQDFDFVGYFRFLEKHGYVEFVQ
ncbi:MAG TPA: M28 family peptidase [Candidatus Solibacter sp.]|nr:M28 family peptidase [Candidatus Solibacter sp.]